MYAKGYEPHVIADASHHTINSGSRKLKLAIEG
jgi:hypothetical protein